MEKEKYFHEEVEEKKNKILECLSRVFPKKIRPCIAWVLGSILFVLICFSFWSHIRSGWRYLSKLFPYQEQGLKDGGFEEESLYWSYDINPRIVTDDSTVAPGFTSYGRTGRGVHIRNTVPEAPNKLQFYRQKIYGLKPNKKYKLSFHFKGSINSARSLWFSMGGDWAIGESRLYVAASKKYYSKWTEQSGIITAGNYTEAFFDIISSDICDIHIDDLHLEEIKE